MGLNTFSIWSNLDLELNFLKPLYFISPDLVLFLKLPGSLSFAIDILSKFKLESSSSLCECLSFNLLFSLISSSLSEELFDTLLLIIL